MDELSTNSSKETLPFLSYHKLLFQELDYFVKEFEASLHICFLKNELTV